MERRRTTTAMAGTSLRPLRRGRRARRRRKTSPSPRTASTPLRTTRRTKATRQVSPGASPARRRSSLRPRATPMIPTVAISRRRRRRNVSSNLGLSLVKRIHSTLSRSRRRSRLSQSFHTPSPICSVARIPPYTLIPAMPPHYPLKILPPPSVLAKTPLHLQAQQIRRMRLLSSLTSDPNLLIQGKA